MKVYLVIEQQYEGFDILEAYTNEHTAKNRVWLLQTIARSKVWDTQPVGYEQYFRDRKNLEVMEIEVN